MATLRPQYDTNFFWFALSASSAVDPGSHCTSHLICRIAHEEACIPRLYGRLPGSRIATAARGRGAQQHVPTFAEIVSWCRVGDCWRSRYVVDCWRRVGRWRCRVIWHRQEGTRTWQRICMVPRRSLLAQLLRGELLAPRRVSAIRGQGHRNGYVNDDLFIGCSTLAAKLSADYTRKRGQD